MLVSDNVPPGVFLIGIFWGRVECIVCASECVFSLFDYALKLPPCNRTTEQSKVVFSSFCWEAVHYFYSGGEKMFFFFTAGEIISVFISNQKRS